MYPKHNASQHKFLSLPVCASFSAFPFWLISTPLFQLVGAEILKCHPKTRYYLFYTVCTDPDVKIYPAQISPLPLIATILIFTINIFSWSILIFSHYSLCFHPYLFFFFPILCSGFLNFYKITSLFFPRTLQIPSHSEENVNGVNKNHKSLKNIGFLFLLYLSGVLC